MNEIKLKQWKMLCTLPYQADFSKWMQEGVELSNLSNWISATVPGSVYEDLEKAEMIENPYFDLNSLNCEWVANRWWVYKTTFSVTSDDIKDVLKLTFKGIDYSAQIYLNGKKLGNHEGMYLPFEAIINDYVDVEKENILVCVLEHAPFADAQPGYTSKTKYMKARFNYKWDFATRLVNLGLYDEVIITRHSVASISHSFVRPIKKGNGWDIDIELELFGYKSCDVDVAINANIAEINGSDKLEHVETFSIKEGFNKFITTLHIDNPKLWWPNGYGEQILNNFDIEVLFGEKVTDKISHKVGFRSIEYKHAEGRADALPYNVVINGKKIYLKGTNMVPICHLQGSIKYDTLREKIISAKECNINFLRIWGGGHIESEAFYDLCDEFGLMVMQEFPMSSSGCDDVPSKNKHFVDLLHKVALHNIKLKRNHTSLTFWSGGNELTDERYMNTDDHEGHPASFEDSTLAMLKATANALSPDIMMLPSSASGPNALLGVGDIGNNHDVHGPWGYVGVYDHYDFYNNSDSIVHGEFGCGGISNIEALKRALKPTDLKLCTSETNRAWRHHSSGWDSYLLRERLMFGDLYDIPFEDYIKINQFVQAESLRYSLEANRRRQWANVGQMTWQFNEPWPNVQCSNVVDYYGGKKLAYYFMRDAYEDVLTSLKYHKLFYKAGEVFEGEIYIINDNKTAGFSVKYEVLDNKNNVIASDIFTGIAKEDISQSVSKISFTIPSDSTGGFIIRLSTECGDFKATKEYLMLIADKDVEVVLSEEEKLSCNINNNKKFNNGLDAKRADTKPVLSYVNNYMKNYL